MLLLQTAIMPCHLTSPHSHGPVQGQLICDGQVSGRLDSSVPSSKCVTLLQTLSSRGATVHPCESQCLPQNVRRVYDDCDASRGYAFAYFTSHHLVPVLGLIEVVTLSRVSWFHLTDRPAAAATSQCHHLHACSAALDMGK